METSYAEASKALEEASSRATEAEKRAAELTEGRKHRVVALRKAEAARKKEQAVIQEKEEFIREQLEEEQPRCAKKAEVMSRKADEAEGGSGRRCGRPAPPRRPRRKKLLTTIKLVRFSSSHRKTIRGGSGGARSAG